MEKQRRIAEYFVIAGLPESPRLFEDDAGGGGGSWTSDGLAKPMAGRLEPITDICVIFPSENELCPPGYKLLALTPGGLPADLNHGSIRSPEVFLCFRKGRDKPPLTDLGVLYEGKERVLPGCEVISSTPYGRCANVNNSNSNKIFLTYRRASDNAASDTLAVTDICVIVTNKGESPPHSYCLINRNLNKGTMVGSSVYLCYKKSVSKDCTIVYRPGLLDRYPRSDYEGVQLPELLPVFAMPMGAVLESWPERADHPKPVFSSFVLTGADGEKLYGAAVTFYEPYPLECLNAQQAYALGLTGRSKKNKSVHVNKAVCIVSRWPFFEAFRKFLFFIRSLACKPARPAVPIERYIEHFMFDIPFPNHHRPRIMVQLGAEYLLLTQPDDSPIPLSGASFLSMLRNLGAEKCMNLLTYVLTEHKLVVHSLRPAVLTVVIEAIGSMIFPFRWQCPYIPLCPLELSGVLSAPTPFIVGIDSQYFDVCEPPPDVTCVDLDTGTVLQPDDKKAIDHRLLPKRPAKVLRATLEAVTQQMLEAPVSAGSAPDGTGIDFKQKQRETSMENTVQEAFLRFMAAILKGYRSYLLPITTAPDLAATSAHMLFDMKGFLKSRDGAYHKFFAQMLNTQLFIRFIEERSFNSKREVSLAFFDECTEKVDENVDTPRLLEADSKGEHTVFVTPPESTGGASPTKETSSAAGLGSPSRDTAVTGGRSPQGRAMLPPGVGCFPMLNHDLLRQAAMLSSHADAAAAAAGGVLKDGTSLLLDGYVAKRTKAEVKLAQKVAVDCKNSYSSLQWAKCLLSTAYSVWFMQLAALTELAPAAPRDALRAALAVLHAIHEQRLHAPDEVCYRALMLLCGMHEQPVLAVKALYEMRQHGVSPNAVTYGVYNKAVLESRWPSTQSTARVMWRRVRLALEGVARFRLPLLSRKADGRGGRGILVAAASTPSLASMASDAADGDSQSRDSVDSEDLLSVSSTGLSMQHYIAQPGRTGADAVPKSKEPELLSTESDMGYNSTSTAEDLLNMIVHETEQQRHGTNSSASHFHTATADTSATAEPLNEGLGRDALLPERKPVKVKPEQPKAMLVTNDDPLGLFSSAAVAPAASATAATCGYAPSALPLSVPADNKAKPTIPLKSMDIGGLFGRSASVDVAEPSRRSVQIVRPFAAASTEDVSRLPKKSTPAVAATAAGSSGDVRSASCSPLDEDGFACGQPVSAAGYVKKSDSLDSRVSIMSSDSSSGGSSALSDQGGTATTGSTDRLAATGAAVMKGLANKMLKSLLPKAGKNGDALAASHEHLATDDADGAQQSVASGQQQLQHAAHHESSPRRRPAVPRALGVVNALKRSGSIGNRLASVTNVVTNKLHDKYNSLVQTVMEIQAPSTIAVSARSQQQQQQDGGGGGGGGARNADGLAVGSMAQPLSLAATHAGAPAHDGGGSSIGSDQLSLSEHRNDSMADSMDDYFAAMDDQGAMEQSTAHTNAGLLSPTFTEQYTPRSAAAEATGSGSTAASSAAAGVVQCCAATATEAEQALPCARCAAAASSGRDAGSAIIEVEVCSCNECHTCGSLLYDEEIMAGWSADDSNLNTACPFCTSKLVPFLSILVKDLRAPSGCRCRTNGGHSVLEERNGHFFGGGDSRCAAPSGDVTETAAATTPESILSPSDPAATQAPPCASSLSSASAPPSLAHVVARASVPYLSPLVLRKELENVLDVEGDQCLCSADFVDQHPIIYWNMIWLFRRLNLVSHMPGFVLTAKGCGVCMPASDRQRVGRRPGHDDADRPGGGCNAADSAPAAVLPPADAAPKSDASSVRVRTIWDSAEQQQLEGRLGRPMYATWRAARQRSDKGDLCLPVLTDIHADVTEEDFAKIVMQQIIRGIESSDMHAPILLLLEHRQQLLDAAVPATTAGGDAAATNGDGKARFRSIYREMLFLGFVHFGKDFLEHDAFDREYKHAFKQLTPERRALLHRSDYPPSPAVMWCRKLFGQLEVS